jgi:hypothetical protein
VAVWCDSKGIAAEGAGAAATAISTSIPFLPSDTKFDKVSKIERECEREFAEHTLKTAIPPG